MNTTTTISLIIGISIVTIATIATIVYFSTKGTPYIPINPPPSHNPFPPNNPMLKCLAQVKLYISTLPTDVKSFCSKLNTDFAKVLSSYGCADKIIVKMINDTVGEDDTTYTFTKGKPSVPLDPKQFRRGDLVFFKVCSVLDTCTGNGNLSVTLT